MNLNDILAGLADERPLFHSEADFQHALAWQIQQRLPQATIRLEMCLDTNGQREYLDILVKSEQSLFAIELKYKTKQLEHIHNGERFRLRQQAAQDVSRYDFIKDIVRLERFVRIHPGARGFAIFLTNDPGYWRESRNPKTVDSGLRIHEGSRLAGERSWSSAASPGTMRKREQVLTLDGEYMVSWSDYSDLQVSSGGLFRFALIEV